MLFIREESWVCRVITEELVEEKHPARRGSCGE